ncbi:MAG: hypothetical protein P1U58_07920 [Verrucomicrobiales bacterium]|nr:hypothetical protein [Verrucomicrobiales bacterium]
MKRASAFFALLLALSFSTSHAQSPSIRSGQTHAKVKMQGWTIHVNLELWKTEKEATTRMAELLDGQLQRVVQSVPPHALVRLRRIQIWVNPPYQGIQPKAEYHPGADWLRENGRDPAMAKGIEFTNVKIFPFENRRMPYVLLHELCHAYHDQVLGFDQKEIIAAYEMAKQAGGYEEVQRFDGKKTVTGRAYALENHREYFAEITEAYFGKNDFFPFNREELLSHDPEGFRVVKVMWGD